MPPVAVTVAEPVLLPKHNTLLTNVDELMAADGWVMLTVLVAEQPLASVTVTVRTPAGWPVMTEVVAAVDHKYV